MRGAFIEIRKPTVIYILRYCVVSEKEKRRSCYVAEKGIVKDEEMVFAKLMERENIQSTAAGNDPALLHQ
jgi:hypothetical protein